MDDVSPSKRQLLAEQAEQKQQDEEKKRGNNDINSVVKVPDTIPEGKEVENHQTPLFANDLD